MNKVKSRFHEPVIYGKESVRASGVDIFCRLPKYVQYNSWLVDQLFVK